MNSDSKTHSEALLVLIPLGLLAFAAVVLYGGPRPFLAMLDTLGRELVHFAIGLVRALVW